MRRAKTLCEIALAGICRTTNGGNKILDGRIDNMLCPRLRLVLRYAKQFLFFSCMRAAVGFFISFYVLLLVKTRVGLTIGRPSKCIRCRSFNDVMTMSIDLEVSSDGCFELPSSRTGGRLQRLTGYTNYYRLIHSKGQSFHSRSRISFGI